MSKLSRVVILSFAKEKDRDVDTQLVRLECHKKLAASPQNKHIFALWPNNCTREHVKGSYSSSLYNPPEMENDIVTWIHPLWHIHQSVWRIAAMK